MGDGVGEEREEGEYDDNAPVTPDTHLGGAQLRLVKRSSDILPEDQRVAIIDARACGHDGVSVGRDRVHTPRVRLPSMLVSKHHANIFPLTKHTSEAYTFAVVDTGSTHGTFYGKDASDKGMNTMERLCGPKQASTPFVLEHLGLLRIGNTIFEIHHHMAGSSTACTECALREDGTNEIPLLGPPKTKAAVSTAAAADFAMERETHIGLDRTIDSELVRRAQMSELRSQHLGTSQKRVSRSEEYLDRAALRRQKNGWQPEERAASSQQRISPHPVSHKDIASQPSEPLSTSNRGYKMFAAMSGPSGTFDSDHSDANAFIAIRGVEGRAGLGSRPLLDVEQIAKRGARQALNQGSYDIDSTRECQRRRYNEADRRG